MSDAKESKNIVDTDRYKYGRTAIETEDGKKRWSKDNGDAVAVAMRGKGPDEILAVLEENGMVDDRYRKYHAEMGPGRFRMTVGQAIRFRWKSGKPTRVDGKVLTPPEGVQLREEQAAA